jgi:ABC-type phosphate transport system substrate-binding protein
MTRKRIATALTILIGTAVVVAPVPPARAASYVPITGSGSTWSATAIDAWRANVRQYGMVVNYGGGGSSQGRSQFADSSVDWAASDIPYGVKDGVNNDNPPSRQYAYMPVTAGGTVFMYNLKIGPRRVTNLRLSGANIAKIFTGAMTRWNDPAIKADNPGLTLPAIQIVPVVRADGSGATAQFTQWMVSQEGPIWSAYCAKTHRNPCTQTSAFPTVSGSGMVSQQGDLGVSGYVSQAQNQGAIGYVQYSYAKQTGFPVAKMLNAANYYTAVATTTALAASNSNPASGEQITLTATVTATSGSPAGSVEFFDNGTSLGASVPLSGGTATKPFSSTVAGPHSLTATFTPTDPTAFALSTSSATTVTVGGGGGGGGGTRPARRRSTSTSRNRGDGQLTVTVDQTPVSLGTAAPNGSVLEATGQLSPVTVNDGRNTSKPGWSVSGQVGDFTGGGNTIDGNSLGWTPAITTPNQANDVTAGPAVAPGSNPGLKLGSGLANAAATEGVGQSVLGGGLDLKVPTTTNPGAYSATLTITVTDTAS